MNIWQALHIILNANEEELLFEKQIQEWKVRSAAAEIKNGASYLANIKKSYWHAWLAIIELVLSLKNWTTWEK